jgi:hypothetical protein
MDSKIWQKAVIRQIDTGVRTRLVRTGCNKVSDVMEGVSPARSCADINRPLAEARGVAGGGLHDQVELFKWVLPNGGTQ